MRKGHMVLERLKEEAELSLPSQSIVEIAGEHRVLIENHCGVTGYSTEEILVRVRFGYIRVSGCQLEICRMTKEQLVICGQIGAVALKRRDRK